MISYANADGFGESGKDNVPADSILMIELELVSWKSIESVTDDKKVMKKVLKPGEGYEKPNDGTRAKGKYLN